MCSISANIPDELKRLLTKRFKEVAILGIDAVSEVKKLEEERIKKLKDSILRFLKFKKGVPRAPYVFFHQNVSFHKKSEEKSRA